MLTSSLHAELCHVFYRQNQLAHDTPNAREGTTSLSLPRSIMHCDDQNDICSHCAASCKRCPSGPNSQCTSRRLGLGTESRCPTDRAARCDHRCCWRRSWAHHHHPLTARAAKRRG